MISYFMDLTKGTARAFDSVELGEVDMRMPLKNVLKDVLHGRVERVLGYESSSFSVSFKCFKSS